jgi:carboxypeptidase C (cathepsin A)
MKNQLRRPLRRGDWIRLAVFAATAFAGTGFTQAAETNAPPAFQSKPPVVTHHSLTVDGALLRYTATAGYLPLENDAGKLQASIFFVAYTRDGVENPATRPITFAFNGGPGASSVWLHLGALGPKRVELAKDGTALPDTPGLVDNDQTWLSFTDLVFVDPVGTGYSRAADGVDAKEFYATEKDIDVAAQFIRRYVTEHERWLSPKFVAGESYGTTRAAALANRLQEQDGLNLRGVILLSSALSFQAFSYDDDNDIAFALALPTFAAAARYHHKADAALADVPPWALNDYLVALARGDTLSDPERQRIAHVLSDMTGLSTSYIEASRLRVSGPRFTKELLRSECHTVGLMDSRVVGSDLTPLGEYPHFDPAFFLVTGPFVAPFNDYVRRELKFTTDRPYEFLSREVNRSWKWFDHGQGYVYVADDLAAALAHDDRLRVFAAAGEYDLTTPWLGQKYVFDHMGLPADRRDHVTFKTYPSGHQIYTDPAARKQLRADVAEFVQSDIPAKSR